MASRIAAAARLNRRVDIERPTTPTTGETGPTYADLVREVPAEILETGGGEYIRGRQVEAGIDAVVTIRYRSDIEPTYRLTFSSRTFNITRCLDRDGRRRLLELLCKEVQP